MANLCVFLILDFVSVGLGVLPNLLGFSTRRLPQRLVVLIVACVASGFVG